MTANPELVAAVRTAKRYLTYVSAGPFQYAVGEALHLPGNYFDHAGRSLVRFAFCKRDEVLHEVVERLPGI